jgi:hypothetical protein
MLYADKVVSMPGHSIAKSEAGEKEALSWVIIQGGILGVQT